MKLNNNEIRWILSTILGFGITSLPGIIPTEIVYTEYCDHEFSLIGYIIAYAWVMTIYFLITYAIHNILENITEQ